MAFKPEEQPEIREYLAARRELLGKLDELLKQDRFERDRPRQWQELCKRGRDLLERCRGLFAGRVKVLAGKEGAEAAKATLTAGDAWYHAQRGAWEEVTEQGGRLSATHWAMMQLRESLQDAHIQHMARALKFNDMAHFAAEVADKARDLLTALLTHTAAGAPDEWALVVEGVKFVSSKAAHVRLVDNLMVSMRSAATAYWEQVQRDGRVQADGLGKLLEVPRRAAMDPELREHYGRWVEEARKEQEQLKRVMETYEDATEKLRKGRFFEDDEKSRALRPHLKDGRIAPQLDELRRDVEEARDKAERARKAQGK